MSSNDNDGAVDEGPLPQVRGKNFTEVGRSIHTQNDEGEKDGAKTISDDAIEDRGHSLQNASAELGGQNAAESSHHGEDIAPHEMDLSLVADEGSQSDPSEGDHGSGDGGGAGAFSAEEPGQGQHHGNFDRLNEHHIGHGGFGQCLEEHNRGDGAGQCRGDESQPPLLGGVPTQVRGANFFWVSEEQREKGDDAAGEEDVAKADRVFAVGREMTGPEIVQFGDNRVGGSGDEDGNPNPSRARDSKATGGRRHAGILEKTRKSNQRIILGASGRLSSLDGIWGGGRIKS